MPLRFSGSAITLCETQKMDTSQTAGDDVCFWWPAASTRTLVLHASARDPMKNRLLSTCFQVRHVDTSRPSVGSKVSCSSVVQKVSAAARHGLPCFIEWSVRYLRSGFHSGQVSLSKVGTLIPGPRRFEWLVRAWLLSPRFRTAGVPERHTRRGSRRLHGTCKLLLKFYFLIFLIFVFFLVVAPLSFFWLWRLSFFWLWRLPFFFWLWRLGFFFWLWCPPFFWLWRLSFFNFLVFSF